MRPVTLALVGAGARGELNLATLARRHAGSLKFTAVAEPDAERRARFAEAFDIPARSCFDDYRRLVDGPRVADAILNALPCRMHYDSTLRSLEAGYHVFLEKPMAHTPAECVKLTRTAADAGLVFVIALQSRYNDIYTKVRRLADTRIGTLRTIDCAENVGYWHFIMSYVRGIHRREDQTHSFVLSKGIHDLDLIAWFAGAPATKVASFGRLSEFRPERAPAGAPRRCTDGCPVEDRCRYSALKQFVDPGRPDIHWSLLTGMSARAVWDVATNPRFRTLASVIVRDISRRSRMRALREESHGYCVYHSDNDVVDHQTVSIEFENEVTASFSLNGFSQIWERSLNLHGTDGEVLSQDFTGRLELRTYGPARVERERVRYHGVIHGGGDEQILIAFADALRRGTRAADILTSAENTLESHLLTFAAEDARRSGRVIDMPTYRAEAARASDAL